MNKKSLKVNKSSIFFLLLMLPYLEPLGFKEEILGTSIIDNIYTIVKLSAIPNISKETVSPAERLSRSSLEK